MTDAVSAIAPAPSAPADAALAPAEAIPASPTPAPIADWRESLGPDYKAHPAFKNHADASALAKDYLNAQAVIGKKGIVVPGDKDAPEAWDNFYKTLGRPETPDAYQFTKPENIPDFVYSGLLAGEFKKMAHAAGLTPKQAATLHDGWSKIVGDSMANEQHKWDTEAASAEGALKKEWGMAYDSKIALAQRVIDIGGPEFGEAINNNKLRNNPFFIRTMAKLGEGLAEHGMVVGRPAGGVLTPEEAKKRKAALFAEAGNDKKHPLYNSDHPEHMVKTKEMRDLNEMIANALDKERAA